MEENLNDGLTINPKEVKFNDEVANFLADFEGTDSELFHEICKQVDKRVEEKLRIKNFMENFAAYECIDQRSQNFVGEFDNLEKLKSIFTSYSNFYQCEPPYPYISIVREEITDGGERKRVGIFFMAK